MPNAIVMTGYGPPEVLEWARVPLAEPGEGQIRIKVKAAGISPTDLALRAGYLKDAIPPGQPLVTCRDRLHAGARGAKLATVPWAEGEAEAGLTMGILTGDMKRLVDEQQLGFCATVCPDGSPNLSPKGSTRVWDDDHLFFGDVCSPQTTANLRAGSLIEVNVVDQFTRKGYRFKGRALICEPGSAEFAEGIERMRAGGSKLTGRVQAIIVIEVQRAEPLISPAYDDGTTTEADMLETHRARFARLHEGRAHGQVGPGHRGAPDSVPG